MSKRGVICKVYADHYFVLTKDGDFVRVAGCPPRGQWLGSEIAVPVTRQWSLIASLAAALALMLIGTMAWGFWQPGADNLLAMEINPGIELAYDDSYLLTGWRGLNQEGQDFVETLELEKGQNLYAVLAEIIEEIHQQELLTSGTVLVTSGGLSPDEDLLLGALEGRGADFELVWLALARDDYNSTEEGPLAAYLRRLGDERGESPDLSNNQKVAEAARAMLPGGLVSHQARGWFDDPVVQHMVAEFGVSQQAVLRLREQGFADEEIAGMARQAHSRGVALGEVAREHGKGHQVPPLSDADKEGLAAVVERRSVLEYLGEQFGHSPGQLTSLLARGFSTEEISVLLLLEQQSGMALNQLLRELKTLDSIDELVDMYSDAETMRPRKEEMDDKVRSIDNNPQREAAREVAREYGFPPGQAMRLLSEGYTLKEVEEAMVIATAAGLSLQQVAGMLEGLDNIEQLWDELGLDPEQIRGNGPPGNKPGGNNN